MVTKLGKVVTYHEELPLIKLHDSLVTLLCEVTWQIKYFISCYINPIIATKHGKVVTYCERLPPINLNNPLNMCSCEVTWWIKNVTSPLSQWLWSQYLQGGEILQEAPNHKFVWTLNEVGLWGHVTNVISYISTSRRPMDTN